MMIKNKVKNYFKKAIIAGIISTGIFSCEKDEYRENPSTIIISKETKILSENQLNKISKIDSTSISFSQAMNYSRGDILVAGISPQSPEGFLRKIETISQDKKTITTSNANLEEAIIKGEINFEKELTLNDLKETKQKTNYNSDGTFSYPVDFVLYDLDNDLSTTNDQIKLEGEINFRPELKFNAKFDKGIKEISLESKLIESANLSFKGNLEREINETKTIAIIPFKPILVTTSPVPIVLTPNIKLSVGSEGYIIDELQFDVNQELEIGGKLNYLSGKWDTSPICEKNISGNVSNVFSDAELLAYLNQRLTMTINGVVGPFMEFQEYAKMEVKSKKTPWWNLNAGLKVNFGSDWGVLSSYLPEINKTIINLEDTILQATIPKDPLAKLILIPNSGEAPLDVFFDGTNSTSGSKIIEYFFDFNDGTNYTETESSNDGFFDGKTTHKYVTTGNYFPKLTIKDELLRSSTVEEKVEVKESIFGSFIDPRDGEAYKTIKLKNNLWFLENLRYDTHSMASRCFDYENNSTYTKEFGKLYDISAASIGCPTGWNLPSDEDWKEIEKFFGMDTLELNKLGWRGNIADTLQKYLKLNFAGYAKLYGSSPRFSAINSTGVYWTNTPTVNGNFVRMIQKENEGIYRENSSLGHSIVFSALSIRCIKSK